MKENNTLEATPVASAKRIKDQKDSSYSATFFFAYERVFLGFSMLFWPVIRPAISPRFRADANAAIPFGTAST
jgi:hypothetical protein